MRSQHLVGIQRRIEQHEVGHAAVKESEPARGSRGCESGQRRSQHPAAIGKGNMMEQAARMAQPSQRPLVRQPAELRNAVKHGCAPVWVGIGSGAEVDVGGELRGLAASHVHQAAVDARGGAQAARLHTRIEEGGVWG